MSDNKFRLMFSVWLVVVVPILFLGIATAVFNARNPLSNRSVVFTNFKDVVTFKKLDYYQINHGNTNSPTKTR